MKRISTSLLLSLFIIVLCRAQGPDGKLPISDIAWHPDGTKIAIAKGAWGCGPEPSPDLKVEIVSYPDFNVLYTVHANTACPIRGLEWSRDGQYLVMGERDWGKAYTWRLADQQIIAVSEPFVAYDRYMDRIQPNGTVVANTTEAIGVNLWDLLTGQPLANISHIPNATDEQTYGVSWSPDGSKLVFGTFINNEIQCAIVETNTYTVIATFACIQDNPLWSPDGQWITTGTSETEYLWNTTTFTLERTWNYTHVGSIEAKWSPDSQYFANINIDGSLVVTRISDGAEIYTLTPSDPITAFAWSPSGDILYGQEVLPNTSLGVTMLPASVIIPSAPTPTPLPPTLTPSPTPTYTCTAANIGTEVALKAQIDAANTRPTPSVLCLLPNTTISLTALYAQSANLGDSFAPLIQKDITIVGNGSTLTTTASPQGRFFRIASGAKLTLDGVTLNGATSSGTSNGGAVRIDGGTLVVKNSTLSGNHATKGGAIFNYQGTLQIENSTLSGNSVSSDGGAVHGLGNFSLSNTTLSQNSSGNNGGALHLYSVSGGVTSQITLTNVNLLNNSAALNGGAVYFADGGTLTFNGGQVKNNTTLNSGGALALTGGTTTANNTLFEANSSTSPLRGVPERSISMGRVQHSIPAEQPSPAIPRRHAAGRSTTPVER